MAAEIRIGTSGWHYKHWVGRYYPAGLRPDAMLAHYLRDFDTVELNNTFYHLPNETSFDNWRKSTPQRFLFAVKGSRFLTHMIKLKEPQRGLANFLPRAERLRRKLGPILWQLPPKWNVNVERLEEFLAQLPKKHRYAFELRNPTWMTAGVYDVLRKCNAAFCIYELAGYQSPIEVTADWTYVRLHGPTIHKYQGSYSDDQLAAWAQRIRDWSTTLKAIFVYFDNDDSAYAVENALTLKDLVKNVGRASARPTRSARGGLKPALRSTVAGRRGSGAGRGTSSRSRDTAPARRPRPDSPASVRRPSRKTSASAYPKPSGRRTRTRRPG
jgi:uncharacterized protein YecE (DUF72 family)